MADSKPNVAALIAQMPDTDQQKLNPNDANAVKTGSKFTGPETEEAVKVYEAVLRSGPEGIAELIAAVRDPSDEDFKDYKAGYLLHGLCLWVKPPDQRPMLTGAIASQIKSGAHSVHAKRILIRELQAVGGKESIAALGECLANAELCDSAVQALLVIREGVIEPLRKALGIAEGRNLVAVIQALGELRDTESLPALRKLLTHEQSDLRRAAAVALTNLSDAESADALLKLADASTGWERAHDTDLCFVLAEKLAAAGNREAATGIYTRLRESRKDERHISDAVARRLEALK
jgi:HEAT repeat protein